MQHGKPVTVIKGMTTFPEEHRHLQYMTQGTASDIKKLINAF